MQGLIFIFVIIPLILSSLTMTTSNGDFSIFMGFLIVPIILSAYFKDFKTSFSTLMGCCIWTIISLFFKSQPFFICSMIFSFAILYLLAYKSRGEFSDLKRGYQKQKDEKLKQKKTLLEENQKMKDYNTNVDRQTEEIENLYEITKRMSAYLKWDEIFKILCSELKNNFEFDDCRLVDIRFIKKRVEIEATYDIVTETKLKEPLPYDKDVIKAVYDQQETLSITPEKRDEFASKFKIPATINTLLAIPLFIDNKIANVVIVENLKSEDFEKFTIVIGQFALEMRKVKLYQLVEKLSTIDGLTKLLLRRNFMEALDKELKRAYENKLKVASLMIDIDHFKRYNDNYGHLAGDRVLARIAGIIRDNTRKIDLISRYGGEEFAVALLEADKEGAIVVAERIRKEVEEEIFKVDSEKTHATVSIGISFFPDDTKDLMKLIDYSDKALYEAKRRGRNNICIYGK